jgi:hypothetical protein
MPAIDWKTVAEVIRAEVPVYAVYTPAVAGVREIEVLTPLFEVSTK